MNYEKRYNEALERAKHALDCDKAGLVTTDRVLIESMFPELKESEDKKIRKVLIDYFKTYKKQEECGIKTFFGIPTNNIIAWLEKQGEKTSWKPSKEQINALEHFVRSVGESGYVSPYDDNINRIKSLLNDLCKLEKQGEKKVPSIDFKAKDCYVSEVDGNIHNMTYDAADKVEPKFHEGEWIVWQNKCYKVNYNGCGYELVDQNGLSTSLLEYGTIEENAHIFTTQDAKDGDVLVNGSNIFIFHFLSDTRLMGYCHINTDDGRFYDDIGKNECFCLIDAVVNPATKEQRDTLFKAMTEAGYEWDDDKKESKLLISNGGDFESDDSEQKPKSYKDAEEASAEYRKFREDCGIKDPVMLDEIEEAYYNGATSIQKPTWSEEDEEYMRDVIAFLEDARDCRQNALDCIEWMKQLKERLS